MAAALSRRAACALFASAGVGAALVATMAGPRAFAMEAGVPVDVVDRREHYEVQAVDAAGLGREMAGAICGGPLPPFAELAHPKVPLNAFKKAWLPIVSTYLRAEDRRR